MLQSILLIHRSLDYDILLLYHKKGPKTQHIFWHFRLIRGVLTKSKLAFRMFAYVLPLTPPLSLKILQPLHPAPSGDPFLDRADGFSPGILQRAQFLQADQALFQHPIHLSGLAAQNGKRQIGCQPF